ncbi:hypothetical protein KDH_64920 [Dictyobacter sp. S3.2.2.5]|uniref:Uncharacterized protein n=1 Tax=Dictyobacter halimunensis TaxID=3026934 RepID=A0ABQ6G1C8_9CHLR|nr:hypothetical protein KDH_64920 [Dictyobacter sp. S3.2.2.5]
MHQGLAPLVHAHAPQKENKVGHAPSDAPGAPPRFSCKKNEYNVGSALAADFPPHTEMHAHGFGPRGRFYGVRRPFSVREMNMVAICWGV